MVRMRTPILLIMSIASVSYGGYGRISGKEFGLWTDDHCVVAVVRVESAVDLKRTEGANYSITVTPLATLAGNLDPTEIRTLTLSTYVGGVTSSIKAPPQEGSLVIAVLYLNVLVGDDTDRTNVIFCETAEFMPNRAGMCSIEGLNDPKVRETIERLRDARAHPDANPYGAPVTQPSTKPVGED
jgi:hypothetical protein